MAAPGTYEDPQMKDCWNLCRACYRCSDKGKYKKCDSCSGCMDPAGSIEPHDEHFCQCTLGVLRWKPANGRLIIRKYNSDPFAGSVQQRAQSEDERDFQSYLQEYRERMENPYVSPISVNINGKQAYYDDAKFVDAEGNPVS